MIEDWRREYPQRRLHSFLGYKPPAPETLKLENLTVVVTPWLGADYSGAKAKTWIGI